MDIKQPYTVVEDHGQGDFIYHYPVKADGSVYLAPIRLCETFDVVGYGTDKEGQHHHVIEYNNGEHCLIARGDVGTNEGWRKLRNVINIPSQRRKLDLLTEYIQERISWERWDIPDSAGWHKDVYILPNGEIIGDKTNILFNGKIPDDKKRAFGMSGSLTEWQANIGQYAAGNSRLSLFLGAAFAAPLLKWFNIEGGILHIYGQSTGGKTTIQQAAQSVWGHGKNSGEDWDATAYALTNVALALNDGLISLDEISKDSDGNGVKKAIYAIANGKGRTRGSQDSGNRPTARFRVLGISTGETDLEAHLKKHGHGTMAGELVRCPSIPHKLENHHRFTDFRSFANHLNKSVTQYYGTAGREFLHIITNDLSKFKSLAAALYEQHLARLQSQYDVNDQSARTARLFAAAMTGAELASQLHILPLPSDGVIAAIESCFSDWLALQPKQASYEDDKILRQAIDFLQTHDLLFNNPESPFMPPRECPGYVKRYHENETEYYIYPKVFRDEICRGFDEKKVMEVLHQCEWLCKGAENRWQYQLQGLEPMTQKRKCLGRFYKFVGIEPETLLPFDQRRKSRNPRN